jgi:hypothetical protein
MVGLRAAMSGAFAPQGRMSMFGFIPARRPVQWRTTMLEFGSKPVMQQSARM